MFAEGEGMFVLPQASVLVTHTVYDLVEPTAGGEVYFLVVDDSWWMEDCITYQPNGWLFISRTAG